MTAPVIVYTRKGCHLCDQAVAILAQHGLVPELIDIDENPELLDRYNHWAPVVVIDGKERFRGRIDQGLLRRLLSKRKTQP